MIPASICSDVPRYGISKFIWEIQPYFGHGLSTLCQSIRGDWSSGVPLQNKPQFPIICIGAGKKRIRGGYDTNRLHLIMSSLSFVRTHTNTQSAHLLYSRLFFSEIFFESCLGLSDFSASFFR